MLIKQKGCECNDSVGERDLGGQEPMRWVKDRHAIQTDFKWGVY